MVAVCARRAVCGWPDVMAFVQYMPDEGASGTLGAVLGSISGGHGVYVSAPFAGMPRIREAPLVLLLVLLLLVSLLEVLIAVPDPELVPVVPVPAPPPGAGRPAMAEVERNAVGRRGADEVLVVAAPDPFKASRLLFAAEESCLSLLSSFSYVLVLVLGSRDDEGLLRDRDDDADVAMVKDVVEEEAEGTIVEDEEMLDAAADDCDRWRMAISVGLSVGRRSWLLDDKWPGVCERGIGVARSEDSAESQRSEEGGGRMSAGDVIGVFLARRSWDDCGGLSRAAALAWSAIVGSRNHFLESAACWGRNSGA